MKGSPEETRRDGAASDVPGAGSGSHTWWVVNAFDVLKSSLRGEQCWPLVLRPESVAQRLEEGRRASSVPSEPASVVPSEQAGGGERLCTTAFRQAESAEVRAVHWFLGPNGTVIAETACGPESSVVLVGWAPHEEEVDAGRRPLPGALLLGIFDTKQVARRLAELVPESAVPTDTVVIGRWSLPDGCPPMAMRSVVHPEPGVLRRELVGQLSEAFCRLQTREQEPPHGGAQAREQEAACDQEAAC